MGSTTPLTNSVQINRNGSMDLIEQKNNTELLHSILASVAKAKNELNCAQADIVKANNRISFTLLVLNQLIKREKDKQK